VAMVTWSLNIVNDDVRSLDEVHQGIILSGRVQIPISPIIPLIINWYDWIIWHCCLSSQELHPLAFEQT
jgi:hypothetical protein